MIFSILICLRSLRDFPPCFYSLIYPCSLSKFSTFCFLLPSSFGSSELPHSCWLALLLVSCHKSAIKMMYGPTEDGYASFVGSPSLSPPSILRCLFLTWESGRDQPRCTICPFLLLSPVLLAFLFSIALSQSIGMCVCVCVQESDAVNATSAAINQNFTQNLPPWSETLFTSYTWLLCTKKSEPPVKGYQYPAIWATEKGGIKISTNFWAPCINT